MFMEGAAAGAGQNALLQAYGPRIVKGDLDPGFFIDFFIKDLKLAYDSATESGLVLDSLANTVSHYEKLFGRRIGPPGNAGSDEILREIKQGY